MAHSVPENRDDKGCKGALNTPANPWERLTDGGQFCLGSTEEKCRQGAHYIASAARASMRSNDYSLSTLGSMIGKDATASHRVLDLDAPSIAMQVLAAALMLDKDRTLLGAMARAVGCEVVERPRLTPEQKLARLTEALRRHGKAGEALIAEAYGEDAP